MFIYYFSYMQPYQKIKRNYDFPSSAKIEIYNQQFLKNFSILEKISIPNILSHTSFLKLSPSPNSLIPCPFCISCFIHPGESLAKEINLKYNLNILTNPHIFNTPFVRPAYCDFINSSDLNKVDNGIFICSQCQKFKENHSIYDYFRIFLSFNGKHYTRNPNLSIPIIELMDVDYFNARCLHCNEYSKYRICHKCAGKKEIILCIAS